MLGERKERPPPLFLWMGENTPLPEKGKIALPFFRDGSGE